MHMADKNWRSSVINWQRWLWHIDRKSCRTSKNFAAAERWYFRRKKPVGEIEIYRILGVPAYMSRISHQKGRTIWLNIVYLGFFLTTITQRKEEEKKDIKCSFIPYIYVGILQKNIPQGTTIKLPKMRVNLHKSLIWMSRIYLQQFLNKCLL